MKFMEALHYSEKTNIYFWVNEYESGNSAQVHGKCFWNITEVGEKCLWNDVMTTKYEL